MNNNFMGICNIVRVKNIQQEENIVSGGRTETYSHSNEMFGVYTDDGKFQKLYRYNEIDGMLKDLLRAGYISYADYYDTDYEEGEDDEDEDAEDECNAGREVAKHTLLEKALKQFLIAVSKDPFKGVCYSREELAIFENKLCIVRGGQMHWNNQDMKAFRYRDGHSDRKMVTVARRIGDKESFRKDIEEFIKDYPLVQLIYSYYLSGAIRQILTNNSEGVGEYGLVACITGDSGSGKTTVTTTLQNVLFCKGRSVSNNITSVGLYDVIRNSGICPVVRDDSSTDTHNGLSHLKDKVQDIYNIASGKCRITGNSDETFPIYAPFIESREGDWGISDSLKPIHMVEGYKYRVLELFCAKGDLTKDAAAARRFSELSSRYSGMATIFLDYLVDHYSEAEINVLYNEYIELMQEALDANDLEHRYANRTAVILLSAKICEEAYGIKMDVDSIKNIIIDSILSFERRIVALPENKELKILYNFFTQKDSEGRGINDQFIVSKVRDYRHESHYVSFMTTDNNRFYIPCSLLPVILEYEGMQLPAPGLLGFSRDSQNIDISNGGYDKNHLKAVLGEWQKLGIVTAASDRSNPDISRSLGDVNTSCYQFDWKKIAKQFEGNVSLDMTRFEHESPEEFEKRQAELFASF